MDAWQRSVMGKWPTSMSEKVKPSFLRKIELQHFQNLSCPFVQNILLTAHAFCMPHGLCHPHALYYGACRGFMAMTPVCRWPPSTSEELFIFFQKNELRFFRSWSWAFAQNTMLKLHGFEPKSPAHQHKTSHSRHTRSACRTGSVSESEL